MQLAKLHNTYNNDGKGLEVLLFPCLQFGDREYHDADKISSAYRRYARKMEHKFHLFGLVNTNNNREYGLREHPLYTYLKGQRDMRDIHWNFEKFLVVDGDVVRHYLPR